MGSRAVVQLHGPKIQLYTHWGADVALDHVLQYVATGGLEAFFGTKQLELFGVRQHTNELYEQERYGAVHTDLDYPPIEVLEDGRIEFTACGRRVRVHPKALGVVQDA